MKMYNYKFDDESRIQPVPIIITEGKYEGLRFQYGRISFDEKEKGNMCLTFDYNLIDNPNDIKEDQVLIDTLGEVLMDVIKVELDEVDEGFLREPVEVNEDS
jgi:Ran GTPase-activating protein (RanGAP) involved in mRNA processing and transport